MTGHTTFDGIVWGLIMVDALLIAWGINTTLLDRTKTR